MAPRAENNESGLTTSSEFFQAFIWNVPTFLGIFESKQTQGWRRIASCTVRVKLVYAELSVHNNPFSIFFWRKFPNVYSQIYNFSSCFWNNVVHCYPPSITIIHYPRPLLIRPLYHLSIHTHIHIHNTSIYLFLSVNVTSLFLYLSYMYLANLPTYLSVCLYYRLDMLG